jgi:hypothetical protein
MTRSHNRHDVVVAAARGRFIKTLRNGRQFATPVVLVVDQDVVPFAATPQTSASATSLVPMTTADVEAQTPTAPRAARRRHRLEDARAATAVTRRAFEMMLIRPIPFLPD